ncbi:MAG: hypothetical protein RBT47_12515 [Anaerolineae bacterium]|jgi:hypothetical protein|nr:hypothetical protein [Anaerolineae bacterium]
MLYQELVEEIKRLSLEDRLSLLELISRSVREELQSDKPQSDSFLHLRGILKPEGPLPSENELADDHTRHLIDKQV